MTSEVDKSSIHPSAFESHTHLAHSIVRYLGVTSPTELATFGLTSAAELVDLISRVCGHMLIRIILKLMVDSTVHGQHIHAYIPDAYPHRRLYLSYHCTGKPFM